MSTHRHSRVSGKLPPLSSPLIQANSRDYKSATLQNEPKTFKSIPVSQSPMAPLNSADLQRIFETIDRNRHGFVSIEELHGLLNRIGGGGDLIPEDLEELIGKSKIDLDEFLRLCESISEKEEEEEIENDVLNAFKVFDENGDGFISSDEIGNVLVRLGLWDCERCGGGGGGGDCSRRMIEAFDTNLDGKLDFQEFKNMILRSSNSSSS